MGTTYISTLRDASELYSHFRGACMDFDEDAGRKKSRARAFNSLIKEKSR